MRGSVRLLVAIVFWTVAPVAARGQSISEGFDSVAGLTGAGWVFINNTPNPDPAGAWRQGSLTGGGNSSGPFAPQSGAAGSYARSDYRATANGASDPAVTVSDWMILPARTMVNGSTLSFYTRTNEGGGYPERLVVRLSTNGASTNVGTTPTSVGDFGTVLLDINPTYQDGTAYPNDWTLQTVTISGLSGPTLGRIAFHHFVELSGPAGLNGNQIGVDTLTFNPVPEPAGLLAVGVAAFAARRLNRRRRGLAVAPASPESRPG